MAVFSTVVVCGSMGGVILGCWLWGLFLLPRHNTYFAVLVYLMALAYDLKNLYRLYREQILVFFVARLFVVYFVVMPIGSFLLVPFYTFEVDWIDFTILWLCAVFSTLLCAVIPVFEFFWRENTKYQELRNMIKLLFAFRVLWK